MLEDIALMRVLPRMIVVVPGDAVEAEKATQALAKDDVNPGYLRVAREASPIMTTEETPFEIGRAYVYRPGGDVTIIATGLMTYQAMVAAQKLHHDGIDAEVIHVPTIKPLDENTILSSIDRTRAVVVCEEGQIAGGLGGAVAELLAENLPTHMRRIGMRDRFGESGKPEELMEHFGLSDRHIVMSVHEVLNMKGK